jgi:hypothetical protein
MSDLQIRGPVYGTTGSSVPLRADITGAQITSDAHGRFQEAALRGFLFSAGMTTTSISNATFTTGTLGATCTPIIGLWNPLGSGKNLVVLQARVQLIANAVTTFTGPGGLMWCTAVNQSAISTGIVPLSRLSLVASGSVGKGFANTALTGLSGNLTVQEASGIISFSNNFSNALTAAGQATAGGGGIDLIDGAIILVPGSVLALLGTTTPVSVSAASSILWEEVPVLP